MEINLKLDLNKAGDTLSFEVFVTPQIVEKIKLIYGSVVKEERFKELAKIIFVSCCEDTLEDYEAHEMIKAIEESLILNAIYQKFNIKV